MRTFPAHPGETEPGPPGGLRYMCPLCDWYYDVPGPDFGDIREQLRAGGPLFLNVASPAAVEAALREHFVSDHTAPVLLSEG